MLRVQGVMHGDGAILVVGVDKLHPLRNFLGLNDAVHSIKLCRLDGRVQVTDGAAGVVFIVVVRALARLGSKRRKREMKKKEAGERGKKPQ